MSTEMAYDSFDRNMADAMADIFCAEAFEDEGDHALAQLCREAFISQCLHDWRRARRWRRALRRRRRARRRVRLAWYNKNRRQLRLAWYIIDGVPYL